MKKLIVFLAAVLFTATALTQSPEKMSYQAVIRNSSNELVTNHNIGMRISILQGSTSGGSVYVETHSNTTNDNGLASIEIGAGTVVSGDFSSIDWSDGPYFIKTETDPSGGTSYTLVSITQLLSVPYALHSKSADALTGVLTESMISDLQDYLTVENDPVFTSSPANNITTSNIANWNTAYGWGDHIDNSLTNEIQTLSLSGTQLTLSDGGGTVTLPSSGGGDITAVYAGVGLDGGGESGDVTLDLEVPLLLTNPLSPVTIRVINDAGHYGYLGYNGSGVAGINANGNEGILGGTTHSVWGRHNNGNEGFLGSQNVAAYASHNNGNFGQMGSLNYGVYGGHNASGNYGYLGGNDYGIYGEHESSGNYGFIGSSSWGVRGVSYTNWGVTGNNATTGNWGTLGGEDYGVQGHNFNGNEGFLGTEDYGVHGTSGQSGGTGIRGEATHTDSRDYGGYFTANGHIGVGVYGEATGEYNPLVQMYRYGGYFTASGDYSTGVYGTGEIGVWGSSTDGVGIFGSSSSGQAGYFGGRVDIDGRLSIDGWVSVEGQVWADVGSSSDPAVCGTGGRIGVQASGSVYDFYAYGDGEDYASSSSIRWKHNIKEIENPLDKIQELRGVYFDWDEEHGGEHDVGMIAEEVGEVLPEIVIYEENGIDATGMDYSKLTPLLVETCKALKNELDELRAELQQLKQQAATRQ